jgi:hypothetical protein
MRLVATRFKGKARTGRGLGAVAQHPPLTIRATPDFKGDEVEILTRPGLNTHQRTQPSRIVGNQRGGQVTVSNQVCVTIKVGDHPFQQIGALDQTGGKHIPLGLFDKNRHMAQRPVTLARRFVVEITEINPGIAQVLVSAQKTGRDFIVARFGQPRHQLLPQRADRAALVQHFIPGARRRPVCGQQGIEAVEAFGIVLRHGIYSPGGLLRSRVVGASRWGCSGGGS